MKYDELILKGPDGDIELEHTKEGLCIHTCSGGRSVSFLLGDKQIRDLIEALQIYEDNDE